MDPKMASKNVRKSGEARQGRQKCAQTLKGTILYLIWCDFGFILVSFWGHFGFSFEAFGAYLASFFEEIHNFTDIAVWSNQQRPTASKK